MRAVCVLFRSGLCAVCFLLLAASHNVQAQELDSKAFDKAMDQYLANDDNVEKVVNAMKRFMEQAPQREVEKQFKNPVKIDIGKSPVKGNPKAPVAIVVFSEFQCPFCMRVEPTLKEVATTYGDKVKFVWKNYPLPMHNMARPAAQAAWAAQQQGKFWEFHDEVFAKAGRFTNEDLEAIAQKLGLNIDRFKKDMASPEAAKAIDEDMKVAESLGVQGTPGFFINGVSLRGAQPLENFKSIIDRWLKDVK